MSQCHTSVEKRSARSAAELEVVTSTVGLHQDTAGVSPQLRQAEEAHLDAGYNRANGGVHV